MDKIVSVAKEENGISEITYTVVFEQPDGRQYTGYGIPECVYEFEVLKRKLAKQYNFPPEAIKELQDKVEALQEYYYIKGEVESDPDF